MTNYRQLKTKDLEKMEVTRSQLLCSPGSGGPIYKIFNGEGSEKLAKFSWPSYRGLDGLFTRVSARPERVQHEHDICKYLYDNGVNVPKPYGVFKFPAMKNDWREFPGFPRFFPAFVMQFLRGKKPTPKYIAPELQKRVEESQRRELEKVKSLGITPIDIDNDNLIWVPDEEKLYLIDFGKWALPGEKVGDFW